MIKKHTYIKSTCIQNRSQGQLRTYNRKACLFKTDSVGKKEVTMKGGFVGSQNISLCLETK